ncbi:MAG: fumarylacetoacetate hydrolase family protein [Geminicoccaceae bacterium]
MIPAPPIVTLPVKGEGPVFPAFPVHRIYCVGRNYAAHTVEMGGDPDRDPPFFFQKNPDNIVLDGRFPYPPKSEDVHHEIEVVVALKSGGDNIPVERALDHVYGYALALDMTRRDLQGEMKKLGRPWEIGKAFEKSCPCGPLVRSEEIGHPEHGAIWLDVNGERRQEGDIDHMIWKVPEMIAYLSELFTLAPGDLILSGTPSGVAAVKRGDRLHGHADGIGDLEVEVI